MMSHSYPHLPPPTLLLFIQVCYRTKRHPVLFLGEATPTSRPTFDLFGTAITASDPYRAEAGATIKETGGND